LVLTRALVDEGLITTCTDDGWFIACGPLAAVGSTLAINKVEDETILSWEDDGIISDYRLYKGFIQTGELFEYNQACVGGPITETTTSDLENPIAGRAFYYLVARETVCGQSELHSDSNGDPIPNDNPCP
jgi:hypothetical protein